MRFMFALLMLTLPAIALAQDVPAKPKVVPEGGQAILAIDNGGHSSMVWDLLFTHDGKQIISIDADKTVQIWDAVTGERLKLLRLPKHVKQSGLRSDVALAPDNRTLAVIGYEYDGAVVANATLLHLETGQLVQLPGLNKKDMYVKSPCFSADGNYLAIGVGQLKKNPSLLVWSGLKDVWKKPLAAPRELVLPKYGSISDVAVAAKGSQLAVAVIDEYDPTGGAPPTGRLYRWDPARADDPQETKLDGYPTKLALSSDGSRLAVLIHQKTKKPGLKSWLQVFSAEEKQLKSIAVLDPPVKEGAKQPTNIVWPVFRSNDELFFATSSSPFSVAEALFRCDLPKGNARSTQVLPAIQFLARWTLSPDGKRAALFGGQNNHEMVVVNVEGEPKPLPIGGVRATPVFAWSKKGNQLAWREPTKDSKLLAALDLDTAAPVPVVDPAAFTKVTIRPDGKFQAAQSFSEILMIGKDRASIFEGKVLLYLYVSGQDWVIWTAEGYYAASPGGEKLVGWQVNNGDDKLATFYPVERFRKQLYRPDVIKLVQEKGSVAEALKAADAALGKETRDVKVDDLLPPRAVVTVDQSKLPIVKVKVKAEASVKDQPITSLRLMLDGRIVPGKDTLATFEDGKAKAEVEWTFELPEGEHQLTVLARCPDSSGVSLPVRVKNVNQAKLPTLHVLTVGINNYKDTALDLKYAAPDAEALAKAFVEHCKGQPFKDVKTKTLLNQDATAKNIARELVEMRKNVAQHDLVIVFFACHGVTHKKEYYLLTHEADVEQLDKTSLSGHDLRKSLGEYKCQVLLMLDACHSAGFGKGKKLAMLGMKPATDDLARDLTDDEYGIAVMCAAMAHEKAEGQGGHGLFTQAVLDALAKKPGVPFHPRNQRVYVHHLHTYVFDQVSDRSDDRQHPFLSLPWVVESFVIR